MLAEGVWVYLFDFVYVYVGNIDTVFSIVSFMSILLMGIYVIGRTSNPLYLVFFINPAYLDLAIGQIRSGFAAGIFWLAVYIQNWPLKLVLLVLAASVHTAFFVFGGFYLAFELLRRTSIFDRLLARPVLSLLLLVGVGLVVTAARNGILMALNDVRGYLRLEFDLGSLPVAGVDQLCVHLRRVAGSRQARVRGLLLCLLCVDGLLLGHNRSSTDAKFSSIALPALAVMCSQLPVRYRTFFLIQYGLFTIVYFVYWFAAQGQVM